MEDVFLIPVYYKDKLLQFEAQLVTFAYSYKILVLIDDVQINFERDDEGDFRAILQSPDESRLHKLDSNLLQAVADSIETILSS